MNVTYQSGTASGINGCFITPYSRSNIDELRGNGWNDLGFTELDRINLVEKDLWDFMKDIDMIIDNSRSYTLCIDGLSLNNGIPKYPVSDIYMNHNNDLIIHLAVTRFSKENIEIYTENNKLHVKGKAEKEKDVKFRLHNKISYKDFDYSITIPAGFDLKSITSSIDNGELLITIPMNKEIKETYKKRVIDIK